jgi:hypothetical protein
MTATSSVQRALVQGSLVVDAVVVLGTVILVVLVAGWLVVGLTVVVVVDRAMRIGSLRAMTVGRFERFGSGLSSRSSYEPTGSKSDRGPAAAPVVRQAPADPLRQATVGTRLRAKLACSVSNGFATGAAWGSFMGSALDGQVPNLTI